MTSRTSREDIENELWKAGIRSPAIMRKLLRSVDAYVYAKNSPVITSDLPELDPGEWDLAQEVTACISCGQVKDWNPYFHVDRSHPSGHRITCKICSARNNPGIPGGSSGWVCPKCRERKNPDMFGREKRESPRKPLPCLSCEQEKP